MTKKRQNLAQLVIPDDWEPVRGQWVCYEIRFPYSRQWIGVLRGMITALARGRTWDGETGSIRAAQAVGRLIIEENFPLRRCRNCGAVDDGTTATSGGCVEWECDEMPCLDLSSLIRINNGVLEVRNACCEWVVIGSLGDADSKPPVGTEPDPVPPDLACRKAYTVVRALDDLLTQAAVLVGEQSTFSGWLSAFSLAVGFAKPNKDNLWSLWSSFVNDSIDSEAAWRAEFSTTQRDQVVCLLAPALNGATVAIAAGERAAIKTVWQGVELVAGLLASYLIDALGDTGLSWLAVDAAGASAADCTCPETVGGDGTLVFLGPPAKVGGDGTLAAVLNSDRSQVNWTWDITSYSASCDWQGTFPVHCSEAINYVDIRVEGVGGDNPPTIEWESAAPFTIAPPEFNVAVDTVTTLESGSLYRIFRLSWDTPATPTGLAVSLKWPGQYPTTPNQLTWLYRIIGTG